MSDEDDEPFVGGPPPDPSERTWRHPSELAAQANAEAMAAAERGATQRSASGWRPLNHRPLSAILAGSLGAAACLTAVAAFQFSGSGSSTLDQATIDVGGAVDISPLESGRQTPTDQIGATTTVTVSMSTAAPAVSTTMPNEAVMASAHDHVVGVVVGGEQVASGIAINGYVLTNASGVGDQLSVSITADGSSQASVAYLVGIDPFSDLAVYRSSLDGHRTNAWSAISTRALDLGSSSDDTTANTWSSNPLPDTPRVVVHPGDAVVVATASPTGSIAVSAGHVIELNGECETPEGRPLVGVIETTARHPEGAAGGLLVANDGTPIGLIVNSTSSLASAIPITEALQIAERLTEQG